MSNTESNIERFAQTHGFAPECPGKMLLAMTTDPEMDELDLVGKVPPLALLAKGVEPFHSKKRVLRALTELEQSATREDIMTVMPHIITNQTQNPLLAEQMKDISEEDRLRIATITFRARIKEMIDWLNS
jgi:hypothetical protein